MFETLQLMAAGFANALLPMNLLMMIFGVTLGIIIGCLPGLSAAMGVALMLPLTFTMEPETGLIVLGAIYCGAIFECHHITFDAYYKNPSSFFRLLQSQMWAQDNDCFLTFFP